MNNPTVVRELSGAKAKLSHPGFYFSAGEDTMHGENFSRVRVIRSLGQQLAYFPRTGDIAQIDDTVFDALQLYTEDVNWFDIQKLLLATYDRADVRQGLREIRSMKDHGLFALDRSPAKNERGRFVSALSNTRPRKLMLLVTEACNLACTYCYEVAHDFHSSARMMSIERVRRVIDRFFEESRGRSPLGITFFGGEPLLNFPAIKEGVRYSKELAQAEGVEIAFCMTTNLTLLTEEMADFLVEHTFAVMVSLDGDEESNDRYRVTKSGKGTYSSVVERLKILLDKQKASGVRPARIRATLTKQNSDPERVYLHLTSLGTPHVMVGETSGTAYSKQDWDISGEAAAEAKGNFKTGVRKYLTRLKTGEDWPQRADLERFLSNGLKKVHQEVTRTEAINRPQVSLCGVCRNMKAVTPSGDLYPCHRYVGMPAYKLGNVNEGGADQNAVSEYYGALHEAFETKCRGCWARLLCGGQCPWYLSGEDGQIRVPDESGCVEIRLGFDEAIALYTILLANHPEAFARIIGISAKAIKGEDGNTASKCGSMPDEVCGA